MSTPTSLPTGPRWSIRCRTSVRSGPSGTTSWTARVRPPGEPCRQVHEAPGSSSEISQTSRGSRGCLIAKRFPIASSGPSSASMRVIDAVHSGHRSTSA